MRIILVTGLLFCFLSPKAQTTLPFSSMAYAQWRPFPAYNLLGDSNKANRKWQLTPYSAVSAGYIFFNGGGATYISAPVGLQLTRQLNNNFYAFAAVSAAPSFFSFNRAFTDPTLNKSYPGRYQQNAYGFGINSRVEMGLMYINDAKTFSISGSIGIESSAYPPFPTPQSDPGIRKH